MRKRSGILLSLLLSAGCVHSYASQPALEFHDIPYQSLTGASWAEKTLALPGVAETYGMPKPPVLTYVELNPGGARTIVFLHGLGSYLKFWRYQLDAFAAAGYRVLALDMVGYGKSSKPASFPYTMESMGDVVWELLKTLDVQRPILVGHSMGGQVALSYSIRYPQDVSALVLTAPAGFERFSAREKAWFTDAFSTTLVKGAAEAGIWGSVRRANFFRWTPEYEWLIEERVRLAQSKEFDQYAYAQVKSVHGLLETGFTRARLGEITAPTLIIHGDEDRLIPNPFLHGGESRSLMEEGAAGIKGSALTTLEGCGHMIQIDCHDDYNKAVLGWLQAHQGAPPASPAPSKAPAGDEPAPSETPNE